MNRFSGYFHLPPYILLSPLPPISSFCRHRPSLLHPLPTSSPGAKRCQTSIWTPPTSSIRQTLTFVSALRMPVSAFVSSDCAPPPLTSSEIYHIPVSPCVFSPSWVPLRFCSPASLSLSNPKYPDIFWCLDLFFGLIFPRGQGSRAHLLSVTRFPLYLLPPLLGHTGSIQAAPLPLSLLPFPSHLVVLISSSSVESVGCSDRCASDILSFCTYLNLK